MITNAPGLSGTGVLNFDASFTQVWMPEGIEVVEDDGGRNIRTTAPGDNPDSFVILCGEVALGDGRVIIMAPIARHLAAHPRGVAVNVADIPGALRPV